MAFENQIYEEGVQNGTEALAVSRLPSCRFWFFSVGKVYNLLATTLMVSPDIVMFRMILTLMPTHRQARHSPPGTLGILISHITRLKEAETNEKQ